MSRWRILVVACLILVPVAVWTGVGICALWTSGLGFVVWWPLMACVALGYLLARYWHRKQQLLKPPDFAVPIHWTARDQEAWRMVEKRASNGASVTPVKLSDPDFYYQTGQELAAELAAFYHAGASDPIANLTVPEILVVIELAAHDLGELTERHLPGGHLMTIRDWRNAQRMKNWYGTATTIYWVISAFLNPLQTGARYAASRVGLSAPLRMLQQNLFLWFYTAFVHRLGTYLIDLNSGRLRGGAACYRQLVTEAGRAAGESGPITEKVAAGPVVGAHVDPVDRVQKITVALVGQVTAGKSSLINALLGEARARIAVVPMSACIERYELMTPGIPTKLVLLDTAGYHSTGAQGEQLQASFEAAREADMVLLVLHAHNPGRQADVDLLDHLEQWFAKRPGLKSPPMIAVVTHIDLLSPSLEWKPPYCWRQPNKLKEESIQGAVATVKHQIGSRLADVIPVCTQPGLTYGIDEDLLPAVALLLEDARGVALLRCLRADIEHDRIRRVFRQMANSGRAVVAQFVGKAGTRLDS